MSLRAILNAKVSFWALLALPATYLLYRFATENLWPDDLVGPTGEWAARLTIFALVLTPLSMLLPRRSWVTWLLRRRRAFGVAAFGYALLHLAFYIAEMETLSNIIAELGLTGIWTGWAALVLMIPLAVTSNDASVRRLGRAWKRLHRLAYPAVLLVLAHWIIVHNGLVKALAQSAPLIVLEAYRIARTLVVRGRANHSMHSTH